MNESASVPIGDEDYSPPIAFVISDQLTDPTEASEQRSSVVPLQALRWQGRKTNAVIMSELPKYFVPRLPSTIMVRLNCFTAQKRITRASGPA